jgi:hypothetical protein
MDPEAAAQFEQNCRELYGQMARIAITPHWGALLRLRRRPTSAIPAGADRADRGMTLWRQGTRPE